MSWPLFASVLHLLFWIKLYLTIIFLDCRKTEKSIASATRKPLVKVLISVFASVPDLMFDKSLRCRSSKEHSCFAVYYNSVLMHHLLKQNVWPVVILFFLLLLELIATLHVNFVFVTCNKDRVDMHSRTNMR